MSAILRLRKLGRLGELGPVLFGVAFLAPLLAQSLEAASLPAPLGLSPIQLGLGAGLAMGLVAKRRGRWV